MTDGNASMAHCYPASGPLRQDIADELRYLAGHLINGAVEDGAVPVKLLCDAADEIERLSAHAQGWQDIGTAPRDYTPILAIENFTRVDDNQLPYPPDQMVVQWSEKANGWASFGIIIDSFEPTHWMPLPAPPSSLTSTQCGGGK